MRLSSILAASTLLLGASAVPRPQAVTFTEPDPQQATGTPGRIPPGNPPPKPNPYNMTGELTQPEQAPFLPAGGINTKPTDIPVYEAMSDFDWQSLALGLHQEYIELDLFRAGLRQFAVEDFEDAGLNEADRKLIEHMSDQEIGHATLISNMLGPEAPKPCEYQYPFKTVREFIDFCQRLTRWGEAGVYGFLPHLDSRAAAQMILQSITTEARQQMVFRQFEGLFPMPEWHQVGVPQSYQWTMLAPYITGCPPENHKLKWANFPGLWITNEPKVYEDEDSKAAISTLRAAFSFPGREVEFKWEAPGKPVGPNSSYVTSTVTKNPAQFVVWISQLNATYTPLYDVQGDAENGWTGKAKQPDGSLFSELNPLLNGTSFVALTDTDLYVTPHNLTLITQHTVAGPQIYQVG